MIENSKILVVEDEESISQLIGMVLKSGGFNNVKFAPDGVTALNMIEQWLPDVVLMDIMLPGMDGLTLCKHVKHNPRYNSVKVIMLTARRLEEDVLQGFENGAIDYITKPFSNKVLLARIRAQLSNGLSENVNNTMFYKEFSINSDTQVAKLNDREINLTYSEFEIMKLFVQNPGRVYSRSQLLNVLRGDDGFDIAERAIDVQIVNLRKKLGDFGANILTVRGVGYKLKEES